MGKDLRTRARVPFGYNIVDGLAVIDSEEAGVLKEYFARFLEGAPMASAAREAGFSSSPVTRRQYIYKKELIGTDYYPAIISEAYQKQLINEYEKRKGRRSKSAPSRPRRGVRIYTDFVMAERADVKPEIMPDEIMPDAKPGAMPGVLPEVLPDTKPDAMPEDSEDPVAFVSAIYQRIQPAK